MKRFLKIVIIIAVCLLCVLIFMSCDEKNKTPQPPLTDEFSIDDLIMEQFWKDEFQEKDYDSFIQSLRDASGLSDLGIRIAFHKYNDPEEYSLRMAGDVLFVSDEIDQYYTQQEDEKAIELNSILKNIAPAFEAQNTEYIYSNSDVSVSCALFLDSYYSADSYDLNLVTSNGREYRYNFSVGWDNVYIDNDLVYLEDTKPSTAKTSYGTYESSGNVAVYDATLEYEGHSNVQVMIFASEEVMDRYTNALVNNNEGTMQEMLLAEQVSYVKAGTKCNIVEQKLTRTKVRLLEGGYAGSEVWVLMETVQMK